MFSSHSTQLNSSLAGLMVLTCVRGGADVLGGGTGCAQTLRGVSTGRGWGGGERDNREGRGQRGE